jgi:hypothetical protein
MTEAARRIAWVVGVGLLLLIAWGTWSHGLFRQSIWTPDGLRRLAIFSAVYWLLALVCRRYLVPVILSSALAWAVASVGWQAVGATGLVVGAAFGIGSRFASGPVAVAAGFGISAVLFGWLAHWPVNHPLLYLALTLGGVALGARRLWKCRGQLPEIRDRFRTVVAPEATRYSYAGTALVLYIGCIHFLAALFPETGSDALAMHLMVPAWIAEHRFWHFDPKVFSWALMPMNADWVFTWSYLLGGEAAARLVNLAMFCGMAWCVHRLASKVQAKSGISLLATALFLSTPIGYLLTGSLFAESFWGLMVLGAIVALGEFRASGNRRLLLAAGMLAGAALSAKLLALAFLVPLAAFAIVECLRQRVPLRHAIVACTLALILSGPPYVEAWWKTGSPTFPFFNSLFRSPLFFTDLPMSDPRYPPALEWNLLWSATFESRRFEEGDNGSLGFQYLLLLPVSVLLLRRKTPWLVWVCLLAGVAAAALIFSQMGYTRYIFPSLALLCAGFAWTIAKLQHRAVVAVLVVLVLCNTYLLASPTYYTRDFALPAWGAARTNHVLQAAPVRVLVDYWNRQAKGAPVAFLEDDGVAGLAGQAYSASWRTWTFLDVLDRAESPSDVMAELRARGIRRLIAPGPSAWFAAPHAVAQGLLRLCGEVEKEAGPQAAWRISDRCLGWSDLELRRRYYDESPVAGPGEHDDAGSKPRYFGRWRHDRQFAQASGHTVTYTNHPGDTVQLRFQGRRVQVIYTAAFNRGAVEVLLDGRAAGRLDQYSERTQWRSSAVYETGGEGEHLLALRLTGERAGGYLEVDAFVVEQ